MTLPTPQAFSKFVISKKMHRTNSSSPSSSSTSSSSPSLSHDSSSSSSLLFLKLNVSLSQVMDQLIFENEFLKQFHESQHNTQLKIIQEWTMEDRSHTTTAIPSSSSSTTTAITNSSTSSTTTTAIPSSSSSPSSTTTSSTTTNISSPSSSNIIHNYSQLISHLKFIPSSQPLTLQRIIQYNQNIIGNSYISYLGIPSQLPCQSNEKLILYYNRCEYIITIDVLETFLKDTSKTWIKYIIQYDEKDQMMVIEGMVQCSFESKFMWGLKSKIENLMTCMATSKLEEWFEMARIELLKRRSGNGGVHNLIPNNDHYNSSQSGHGNSNGDDDEIHSIPIMDHQTSPPSPPPPPPTEVRFQLLESSTNEENTRHVVVNQHEEEEGSTTTSDDDTCYYSIQSSSASSSPTTSNTTNTITTTTSQLIDHSYHLVTLKNELLQLKALSNQLDMKIKNLENHIMADHQLHLLIKKYYSKISQLIHTQKLTRFRLKNRLKLLSLIWFIIGLFLTPILYGLYRFNYRYTNGLFVRK